jgi:hypothetical protein
MTAAICGQSPGGGDVERNHIVDKPYRPELYIKVRAWLEEGAISRTPLLHVLY